MKTSHAITPTANNFLHPRKPTRRHRLLHRSLRYPMPSSNQNDNVTTSTPSNPSSQHPNNTWNHNHIFAIAEVVAQANTTDPSKLFPSSSSKLPDALNEKTRDDVVAVVENLLKSFDESVVPFAQDNNPKNFLAVLASEINFLKKHREQRESALAQLKKARAERRQVERSRQRLVAESKSLTKQIQQERARRTSATERKPQDEANLENEKRLLEQHRQDCDNLRDNLEQAKLAELDVRRQLDRMRLKIAAMRGEMIIPTVDKLSSRSTPKWLSDFDASLISGESDPKDSKESDATMETPPKPDPKKADDTEKPPDPDKDDEIKPDVEMELNVPTEDIESPDQSANDDLGFDESNEETEFRLLKNRLAMVEMEAEEWKQCVEYQRQQVRLITRSKARLEEELARQKQGGGSKATGSGSGRGAGKSSSGSAKATARLRATIRASLPPAPDTSVRKPIRKSRKGRPKRALVPELP